MQVYKKKRKHFRNLCNYILKKWWHHKFLDNIASHSFILSLDASVIITVKAKNWNFEEVTLLEIAQNNVIIIIKAKN